jgi:flagellar hook-associated protein 1 FlgK
VSIGPLEGLNTILSGMNAAQATTETAGQNIANASNPNYATEVVEQAPILGGPTPLATGSILPGSIGAGVTITGIERQAPAYLSSTARAAMGQSSYANTWASALNSAQQLYQEPSANGLNALMTQYFNDLNVLAQDPSNAGAKSTVVGDALTLVQAFHTLAGGLQQAATNATTQLQDKVGQDNTILSQIATLNGQIQELQIAGNNPNALLDQRSGMLDQLAKDLGATVSAVPLTDANGQPVMSQNGQPVDSLQLTLPDGTIILSGTTAATLNVATSNGAPSLSVTMGTTTTAPTFGPSQGGSVGALLALLSPSGGVLSGDGASSWSGSWLNQLDQVASTLATAINQLQTTGYAPDPTTGAMTVQTNTPFFVAGTGGTASATGPFTAANLTVNPALQANTALVAAASSTNVNDGSNAQAMANVAESPTGPLAVYRQQIGSIGTTVQSAEQVATTQQAVAAQTQQARESVTGVNINQEVVSLSFAAQTYQALAKTMGTIQSMVASVINAVQ